MVSTLVAAVPSFTLTVVVMPSERAEVCVWFEVKNPAEVDLLILLTLSVQLIFSRLYRITFAILPWLYPVRLGVLLLLVGSTFSLPLSLVLLLLLLLLPM